ncbi:single-stranded DNA-binding protein [Botrimarina mediterranea]|uniref:Single-stranded DNA-binding protein n=1 Tax=Botrimarina mediterranea TaxID=2528022 RepID=A0A518K5X3_9BACT|nr:single-stranded DNA-binding protein [Botrimarina mediterranea]QDV73193.1 Single-stranded DNA-binding protein [Botrimarina mediterranea]
MPAYNKVTLVGNLTRDIELRYTPNGKAVTEVGVAINERVKTGDTYKEQTVFVDVTFWGRTAEVAAQYLKKGDATMIEGRLAFEQWQKDGQKRSKVSVTCEKLVLLGAKAPANADAEHELAGAGGDSGF